MNEAGDAHLIATRSTAGWGRKAPEFRAFGAEWKGLDESAKFGSFAEILPAELGGWIDRLNRAGIVVDRRNSPDLLDQMSQVLRRPIDTVLCGVLDADPAACLNSALAAQFPLELAAGMTIIGRLTRARRAAVITDARIPSNWFSSLREFCSETGIRVEPVINDYPQADPTLMVYALLGRRLRPGRLPTDQGVVLLDAAAAITVGRFALLDEAMIHMPMVLRDQAQDLSHYLIVPVGTTLADLLQRLDLPAKGSVLRAGEVLRDVQVQPDAVIGPGELVYHISPLTNPVNPNPCIRCGWCVDTCPTRVQPATVLEASQREDMDLAEHAGIEACIECGICSYVCPSNLPLLQGIRKMKTIMKESPA